MKTPKFFTDLEGEYVMMLIAAGGGMSMAGRGPLMGFIGGFGVSFGSAFTTKMLFQSGYLPKFELMGSTIFGEQPCCEKLDKATAAGVLGGAIGAVAGTLM